MAKTPAIKAVTSFTSFAPSKNGPVVAG